MIELFSIPEDQLLVPLSHDVPKKHDLLAVEISTVPLFLGHNTFAAVYLRTASK